MTKEELLISLSVQAKRTSQFAPDAVWYLFGSVLSAFDRAADIDVVVLCDNDESVSVVRRELREVCARLPLHLFLLTRKEETELRFIVSEGCLQVYPASSPSFAVSGV